MIDRPIVVAGAPGNTWQVIGNVPLPVGIGGLLAGLVAVDNDVVVVGTLSDGTPSAWVSSDDGHSWTGPTALPAAKGSSVAAIEYSGGEYVAVGESVGPSSGPGVWRSPDGITWVSDDSSGTGSMAALRDTPSGLIAVGNDGTGAAAIRSLDGASARLLRPPDLAELSSVADLAGRLMVASAAPVSQPIWQLTTSGWEPVDVGEATTGTVHALAASASSFAAAGDDGLTIRVVIGPAISP